MPEVTENLNKITEDVTNEEILTKLDDLKANEDKTPEQKQEFSDLRAELGKRDTKSRINQLTAKQKAAEEKATRLEQELADRDAKLAEFQSAPAKPVQINEDTVKVGDENYFTDDALMSQIKAGKMTDAEAVKLQQKRERKLAVLEARDMLKKEQTEDQQKKQMKADIETVFTKYPKWNDKHAEHNPEDPIYKTATEFYNDGMPIKKAMLNAEKVHGVKPAVSVDLSNSLNVNSPTAPPQGEGKLKDVDLTDYEKEAAVSMFTKGDVLNPKTQRAYTESEALAKAKAAKNERIRRNQ